MSLRLLPSFYSKLKTPSSSLCVTFIGMPGSGKTYWAHTFGYLYNKEVLELDDCIELRAKKTLLELTQEGREGERRLRQLENNVMKDVLRQHMYNTKNGVFVSPGGSCVYARCAEEFFAHPSNLVVFLNVPFDVLHKRTDNFTNRGIVFNNQTPKQLKQERDMLYNRFADVRLTTTENQSDNMYLLQNMLSYLYFH